MERFLTEYKKQLAASVAATPDRYKAAFNVHRTPEALVAHFEAMIRGHGIRVLALDSEALRLTCKALGIKHTYKAMEHFIANHA